MTLPEIRNARLIRDGVIECEIFHPALGWIPYGAVSGADGQPGQVYAAALATDMAARDPVDVLAEERSRMVVSRFQARVALHSAGLLAVAEAAIEAGDPIDRIAWQDAAEWRRDSPTIARIAVTLGLTDEQVDDLFHAAATITA